MEKSNSKLWLIFLLLLLLLGTSCSSAPASETAAPTLTSTPDVVLIAPSDGTEQVPVVAAAPEGQPGEENEPGDQILISPTPELTATPGKIQEAVSEIATATGLNRQVFFGLTGEDWVNLGISLLISLVGVLLITRLVYLILLFIVRSTPSERDEIFLRKIQSEVRWIVGISIVQYSTNRLLFLSPEWKQSLNQLYFAVYIAALTAILWKLIAIGMEWYKDRRDQSDEHQTADVFSTLLIRALRGLLVIIAATIVLNNYGINVTALLAVLGIGGLALSLAAQDTLSDMINGFLILVDQPFRVGDRIGIKGLDTWGDVLEVGTRTTRIRTRDNRMVVVPNSSIGKSQVVNYTYPDPTYRMQTHIDIAYGSDINKTTQVIQQAVRRIEGIQADKPVDALVIELGHSALVFRVRWWIDSYIDTRHMLDKVHRALYTALEQAGIELPYTTYDINLKDTPRFADRIRIEDIKGKD